MSKGPGLKFTGGPEGLDCSLVEVQKDQDRILVEVLMGLHHNLVEVLVRSLVEVQKGLVGPEAQYCCQSCKAHPCLCSCLQHLLTREHNKKRTSLLCCIHYWMHLNGMQ